MHAMMQDQPTSSMSFSVLLCRWRLHLVRTISGAPFIMITFLAVKVSRRGVSMCKHGSKASSIS